MQSQKQRGSLINAPSISGNLVLRAAITVVLLAVSTVGLSLRPSFAADEGEPSCIACHRELDGELAQPVQDLPASVHARAGISCHDCHGGDPALGFDGDAPAAMDPARGYRGAPSRAEVPSFCGRCHSDEEYIRRFNPRIPTDQEKVYWTSRHGKRLKQGDPKVAECVNCHGSHLVRAVADAQSPVYPLNVPGTCAQCHADSAYMEGYGIGTGQMEEYKQGVHGQALLEKGDLGAPACNDCHGNHGATPPGVTSVANVCGLCHPSPRDMFLKSPHHEPFDELGFPECSGCHSNHLVVRPTDAMLGTGEGSTCVECHSKGDEGFQVAGSMRSTIDELASRYEQVTNMVERAEWSGLEMTRTRLLLQEVHDHLVRARNTVHTFDLSSVTAIAAVGDSLAGESEEQAHAAFRELRTRRLGLALSSLIIALVVVALVMKIRRLDRTRRT